MTRGDLIFRSVMTVLLLFYLYLCVLSPVLIIFGVVIGLLGLFVHYDREVTEWLRQPLRRRRE